MNVKKCPGARIRRGREKRSLGEGDKEGLEHHQP